MELFIKIALTVAVVLNIIEYNRLRKVKLQHISQFNALESMRYNDRLEHLGLYHKVHKLSEEVEKMAKNNISKANRERLVFQIAMLRIKYANDSNTADLLEDAIFDTLSNVGYSEATLTELAEEVVKLTGAEK